MIKFFYYWPTQIKYLFSIYILFITQFLFESTNAPKEEILISTFHTDIILYVLDRNVTVNNWTFLSYSIPSIFPLIIPVLHSYGEADKTLKSRVCASLIKLSFYGLTTLSSFPHRNQRAVAMRAKSVPSSPHARALTFYLTLRRANVR